MTKKLAQEAIDDLRRTALQPDSIGVEIDPVTGDAFFIYLFAEHAPFCVRLTPEFIKDSSAIYKKQRKKRSH
jgi:hypothetical protein